MRVVVLGAAIVRAARSLGHPCRLVDVAGSRRRLGGLANALGMRLAEGFLRDAVVFPQAVDPASTKRSRWRSGTWRRPRSAPRLPPLAGSTRWAITPTPTAFCCCW